MEETLLKYTTIIHSVRISLELSCNEYCIADCIYHLSNNPNNKMQGWCYASKESLGEMLGLTKQSVHSIQRKLIEKGLIEKHYETRHLRTTELWYNLVISEKIKYSKESLPIVNIDSKESLPQTVKKVYSDSKESLPNNNINNYKNNNIYATKEDFEVIWKEYPARNGKKLLKQDALNWFLKNITKEQFSDLEKAVKHYAKSKTAKEGYAKDAVRWLKKEWQDWITPERTGPAPIVEPKWVAPKVEVMTEEQKQNAEKYKEEIRQFTGSLKTI